MKNLKYILFPIVCILLTYNLFGSGSDNVKTTLSGKITDLKSGEPLPGVYVSVPELSTGAETDLNGNYRINNLPKTKVLVQVSFVGYRTIVQPVDLTRTSTFNYSMKESAVEINEVVVTGSSTASDIRRNPAPLVSISARHLQQSLSTNIIDAISEIPGINAITTGPNISKPSIRGLGYNRVLTLYDGIRQEGQQWGDEHGIEIDQNTVHKVEIIKGPASLTYGSDALAGVVNLLPAPPVPDGTVKGSVLATYESNNGMYEGSANLAGNNKGFTWGGVVTHKQATNYQNKHDGRVFGTAFNESDASGYIGLNRGWGYSRLAFSLYNDLQEIPDGSRDSVTNRFTKQITDSDTYRPVVTQSELNSYRIEVLHQLVQHYKVYSSSNFIFGSSKLDVNLAFQSNVRREFSHPQSPSVAGLYLLLNTVTYGMKYHFPGADHWNLMAGINGMYQTNTNKGTEFIIPNYHQFDLGPFFYIKKTLGNFTVSGGLRYDRRQFMNDQMYVGTNPVTGYDMQLNGADTVDAEHPFNTFHHVYSGISGSLGATWFVSNNLSLKANIARGYRAPNIAEISANGVHPGTNIYQIGNPSFKPEFSLQEDLGMVYSTDHVYASIDFFNNDIYNYIFNQKILNSKGQDSIIVAGNETFKFQQAHARLYGGEADIDIHPHPLDWLHFENTISLLYAENRGGNGIHINDSSKYLPFIPPLHTTTELRAEIPGKYAHFSSLFAKIEMEHYAKQNRVYLANQTETPTPGYTLFNAGIGARVNNRKGEELFYFSILCNNVLNKAYQSHLSRLKYMDFFVSPATHQPVTRSGPGTGIYNMGRNLGFKINVPI